MTWYSYEWGMVWVVHTMVTIWLGDGMGFPVHGTMVLEWSSYTTPEWVPQGSLNQGIDVPHRHPKLGDWRVNFCFKILVWFISDAHSKDFQPIFDWFSCQFLFDFSANLTSFAVKIKIKIGQFFLHSRQLVDFNGLLIEENFDLVDYHVKQRIQHDNSEDQSFLQ